MVISSDLDKQRVSYHESFPFHKENEIILSHYARKIEDSIQKRKSINILSLGVGQKIVTSTIMKYIPENINTYTIIEGSSKALDELSFPSSLSPKINIINSFFEEFKQEDKFDIVEAGFILEHVDDPNIVLEIFKKSLVKGGRMHIAVPNAQSLHRRIGLEAGLLSNFYQLSSADIELGHQRYFDVASLKQTVAKAGLKIINTKGIYIKPFTTSQIEKLNLEENIVKAMCLVGESYPELCNAIYVEVERS